MNVIICTRCHTLMGYTDDLDQDRCMTFYCPNCVDIKEKGKT